ncbi:universal stress protein [Marinomonas sp. C2222]|uniref:Universal stress protein n=1 Tax=Marinomonas sargassi TaxID=2984494 RepID=A0ABT2YRN4_9GAMM|nr:universal stress protein [Marinomonas sargassi]MCV2402410.1 universal stress protein [Marinomonas sargassi]
MMLQVSKILYCTDLSKGAEEAFKYAAFLSKCTKADIHILHVVEKLSSEARMTLETYVMDSDQRKGMLKARKEQALQVLKEKQEEFWDSVPLEDLKVRNYVKSLDIVESFPMEAILGKSKALSADLIVMGTHEKGLVETFLGSVARNVLARSRIPVLVVPLAKKEH